MAHAAGSVPYFAPTEPRALSREEREILEKLLTDQGVEYTRQLHGLMVVGRCGCGVCPTVFFVAHTEGDREHDLVSYVGTDSANGLVGAVLMQKDGLLSQLEFYSVDGHDPWSIPEARSLRPQVDA